MSLGKKVFKFFLSNVLILFYFCNTCYDHFSVAVSGGKPMNLDFLAKIK